MVIDLLRTAMKLNIVTAFIVIASLLLFGVHAARLPWTPWHIAGAAIALPALFLVLVARAQLGGSFSVRPKATALVTTGLYSRIRNPIYVFSFFVVLGVILWTGNLWLLLLLAILVPMQIIRSRKEEAVLRAKFGAAYDEYKQKTWF